MGKTFGDAFTAVWRSVDALTLGADGHRIEPGEFIGVQTPEATIVFGTRVIGKEGRRLGTGRGVLEEPEYVDFDRDDFWPVASEAMNLLEAADPPALQRVAEAADVSPRWLRKVRSGTTPGRTTISPITRAIADEARQELVAVGRPVPRDDRSAIASYVRTMGSRRTCQMCGTTLRPRQRKWCSDRCRKQASRRQVL